MGDWTKYDVTIRSLGARLLVAPDESESGVAVVEHTLSPGTLGSPLHRHSNEDELSVVLDGELSLVADGEESTVGPGEAVAKPRGEWHAFWNAGTEPLRFIEVVAPGGFAGYFEEVAAALRDVESQEQAIGRVTEIAGDYDVEMDFERTGELLERHGLQL